MSEQQSGWYADPTRRHTYRYWDGAIWSNQVSDGGTAGLDPMELDESTAATPPAPGTQAPGPEPAGDRQQPSSVEVSQSSGGTNYAAILGVVIGAIIVIVILVIVFNNAGDDTTEPTDAPSATVTTQAPEDTEPPATTTP